MRILYVARHDAGQNDDEGAIAYALEQLGHEVVKVQETGLSLKSVSLPDNELMIPKYDFCLFHKLHNMDFFQWARGVKIPLVFWYFDLVDWPQDLTLSSRCEARKRWMAEVTPIVDVGFCTDGDWVVRDTTDKLHVLRQGADERMVGFGEPWKDYPLPMDVLFVGGVKGCGVRRESFVRELRERYGNRFAHFGSGVYGRALANAVAASKIVVCPDSPVTDRYWSNRVYVMMGFGACVFHPRVEEFVGQGLVLYDNREHLFGLLEGHLDSKNIQYLQWHRTENLKQVKEKYLYRHRIEEMLNILKNHGIG